MKKPLKLPKFDNEDQELEFWSRVNLVDYYEVDDAQQVVFPKLKPSSATISLRLPKNLLNRIKSEAHMKGIPYQSLMKAKLDEIFGHPAVK